jgi:hypothetical protein
VKGKEKKNIEIQKGKGNTKAIKRKRADRISKDDMRHIRMKNKRK